MTASPLHVLISSVSKKVPLVKAVRSGLKKIKHPNVITGADSDPCCVGQHFTDHFWHMPRLESLSAGDFVSYCQYHGISRIIPTRDGELEFYAKNKDFFLAQGLHSMISDWKGVESCLDKLLFYELLSNQGFPVIETSESIEDLDCDRFVVKERFGAGGLGIAWNLTKKEAEHWAKKLKKPLFQPYISGPEVSIDLYVDRFNHCKAQVLRWRECVVHGESQVTKTFRDEGLEKMSAEVIGKLGLYGHVMLQCIYSKDDQAYHLLECNPRFGGASTLSLQVGLESFYWFFLETLGANLSDYTFLRSSEEKRLIRYAEDLIVTCPMTV